MEHHAKSTRQHVGRTFVVSISLVGLVALAQICAVAYAFVDRATIDANPQQLAVQEIPVPDADIVPSQTGSMREEQLSPAPLPAQSPISAAPKASARVLGLIDQAKEMRERGDTKSAIIKLREAQTLAPDNPVVLSELAATFEIMGLHEKSLEQWRKVFDMGPASGALLQLAEMKLKGSAGMLSPTGEISQDSSLQPGSVLGLIDVRMVEEDDPNAQRKFKLRVGLKARSGEAIDVRNVIIQVFFYDMLDGQHIVQTNANVNSQWTTLPPDWKDDGIEILEVGYTQPLSQDANVEEDREYLGYIVRVYYKDQLEDVRADPVRLLTLFPPPLQVDG